MSVIVVDSIMGSGKSTWALNYMKSHPEKKWLFVTPYISEIERAKEECHLLTLYEPEKGRQKTKNKGEDLVNLIEAGENIATTHSLFLRIKQKPYLLTSIQAHHYNLIVDETLDVVANEKISTDDIRALMAYGVFKIDEETKSVQWLKNDYEGSHNNLREHAETGIIYSYRAQEALIWMYKPDIFMEFDSVYILTYIFNGSRMKCYFQYFKIPYDLYYMKNGEIAPGSSHDREKEKRVFPTH